MYTHTDGRQFGTGAKYVKKDYFSSLKVGRASAPFDWQGGFIDGIPSSVVVIKNQGSASDCGMASSNYGQEQEAYQKTGVYIPLSDHYGYGFNHANGGGMTEQQIVNAHTITGIPPESVYPSYKNGNPPDEAFMEDVSDVTPAITAQATTKEGTPVYLDIKTFDDFATAINTYDWVEAGFWGQDNHTWLSENPQIPSIPPNSKDLWAHWLRFPKVKDKPTFINGKKALWFTNSWGEEAGQVGWQYFTEEYLPYGWCFFTFLPKVVIPPQFQFTKDLSYGMTDIEVGLLQKKLGLSTATNYFGKWTLINLIYLQAKNGIPYSSWGKVDQVTRDFLNRS